MDKVHEPCSGNRAEVVAQLDEHLVGRDRVAMESRTRFDDQVVEAVVGGSTGRCRRRCPQILLSLLGGTVEVVVVVDGRVFGKPLYAANNR